MHWHSDGYDSGINNYDFAIITYLCPCFSNNLALIMSCKQGHITSTLGSGSRDFAWDETLFNSHVTSYYNDYASGSYELNVNYASSIESMFESLLSNVIKWTISNLLDGTGLIIFVSVKISSLVSTSSLIPGTRILGNMLWLTSPGNTLLAIAAEGIVSARTRTKVLLIEDYN